MDLNDGFPKSCYPRYRICPCMKGSKRRFFMDIVDLACDCVQANVNKEDEDKSPILLLHGILGSRNAWNSVNLLLSSRTKRNVYAVDLRNHGDSPWNRENNIQALTLDIGKFLDKNGIQKVNLIGHSLGGRIAMIYALKNPDRVDSVIIEDVRHYNVPEGSFFDKLPYFKFLEEAEKSLPVDVTADEAKESLVNFLNRKFEETGCKGGDTEKFSEYLQLKCVDGKWGYKHNAKVLYDFLENGKHNWPDNLGVYNGPTLFIHGTKSPLKVPEDKTDILSRFPKAEFVAVEGAGHYIHGLFPEFDDAVVSLLNKVN